MRRSSDCAQTPQCQGWDRRRGVRDGGSRAGKLAHPLNFVDDLQVHPSNPLEKHRYLRSEEGSVAQKLVNMEAVAGPRGFMRGMIRTGHGKAQVCVRRKEVRERYEWDCAGQQRGAYLSPDGRFERGERSDEAFLPPHLASSGEASEGKNRYTMHMLVL